MRYDKLKKTITLLLVAILVIGICISFSSISTEFVYASVEIDNDLESLKHDRYLIENTEETLSRIKKQDKTIIGNMAFIDKDTSYTLDEVSVILTREYSLSKIDKNLFLNVDNIKEVYGIEIPTEYDRENKRYRQILTLKLSESGDDKVMKAIDDLQKLDEVLLVEPMYKFNFHDEWVVPNDPLYNGVDENNIEFQWGLSEINMERAWGIYNNENIQGLISVGILEGGAQLTHPDLRITNGNIDNSVYATHGTLVAGIIGAISNNNIGIAGITPCNISILNRNDLYETLRWAQQNGIKIVNASYYSSAPTFDENGNLVTSATHSSRDAEAIATFNGLFIAAAGNSNYDIDLYPMYPACYNCSNIIVVGSIDYNEERSYFSNYGNNTVDIFAPGRNILSTYPMEEGSFDGVDGYSMASGTSMAAPHVAGVAALLWSYNPHLTKEQVKALILNNANPLSSLDGLCSTGGILDAYRAIKNTPKTDVIYRNFGYIGDDYYWKGKIEMDYFSANEFNESDITIIDNNSEVVFRLKEVDHHNLVFNINGEIIIELQDFDENVLQSYTWNVQVNVLSQSSITGNSEFVIDTSQLETGTYYVKITSSFTRYNTTQRGEYTHIVGVNKTLTVMSNFGYTSSWYKWKGAVKLSSDLLFLYNRPEGLVVTGDCDLVFNVVSSFVFNAVKRMSGRINITLKDSSNNEYPINGNYVHVCAVNVGLVSNATISNNTFTINPLDLDDGTYTIMLSCSMTRDGTVYNNYDSFTFTVYNQMCVAEGTLVTLDDGTQMAVENLTGEENLLVWNMLTGEFDSASILFVDKNSLSLNRVINLSFSDGANVKVVYEHAFWDIDLNRYVFLRDDAFLYIGHRFRRYGYDEIGNIICQEAYLTNVDIRNEIVRTYSPITYSHLCYYVNGFLSMPGATEGLINIFEVDENTMAYNVTLMQLDIETYGLYTYNEFIDDVIEIPENIFNAFNGQYLKISIGKGFITIEELVILINKYSTFF